jgi:hypothetical protein
LAGRRNPLSSWGRPMIQASAAARELENRQPHVNSAYTNVPEWQARAHLADFT